MTIVEFIEARIAEDEKVARAAAEMDGEMWSAVDPFGGESPDRVEGEGVSTVGYDMHEDVAPHVARHDPARVLRQCTALRAALASAQDLFEEGYSADDAEQFLTSELAPMAAIWSDHPDYQSDWA